MSTDLETSTESTKYELAVTGTGGNLGEIWSEEMSGFDLSFDRVKVPAGGGLSWEVPGDDPNRPGQLAELVGVIVDHHPISSLWLNPFTGDNQPPDAYSLDGKVQVLTDAAREAGALEDLASCPFNQWGSAHLVGGAGGGKATKNMHRIYLLGSGEAFPWQVTLPPTSVKAFGDFLGKRIVAKSRRSTDVVVSIGLVRDVSKGGITYSKATFQVLVDLDPVQVAAVREYAASIRTHSRSVAVADDEYGVTAPNPATATAVTSSVADDDDIPF